MDYKDNVKYCRLYDIYGKMLTNNQKEIFEDYYFNNLSFGEIAENRNISRQAVDFALKNVLKTLNNFETKLLFNQKLNNLTNSLNLLKSKNNLDLNKFIDELISKIWE